MGRARAAAEPGGVGPVGAPVTRLLLGAIALSDPAVDRLARIVAADVVARYLSVAGRRAVCVVAGRGQPSEAGGDEARASAVALGAWSAGAVPASFATSEGVSQRQRMIESLAKLGILSSRGFPFRSCPECQTPRTPETIVYQSERGPGLPWFDSRSGMRLEPTSLLVWTDNPWKLLATSAVLVSPDLAYVTAVYRRRGVVERIILAKSAIPRLQGWLPLRDRNPRGTDGRFDRGHRLRPPARDRVTRIVAPRTARRHGSGHLRGGRFRDRPRDLVPRHGAADSQVATALRVDGPVVVTPAGLGEARAAARGTRASRSRPPTHRPARPAGLGPHLRRAHRATRGSALRDLWLGPHLAARPRLVPRDRPITGERSSASSPAYCPRTRCLPLAT